MHQQTRGGAAAIAIPIAFIVLVGCGEPRDDLEEREVASAAIGVCQRNEPILRGTPGECTLDLDCPCGAFCDDSDHRCHFECMVPPATQAESCATGTQCDDTGRCVPRPEPPRIPQLSSVPISLTTVPGGPPKQLQARLTVATSAEVTAAAATVVRVVGDHGATVSCDGTTFDRQCSLTGWSFSFDGIKYNAARPVWVQTAAGTPNGSGDIQLRIERASTVVTVPTAAGTIAGTDGRYTGRAVSDAMPGGFQLTAAIHDGTIVVRDPARVIAPDGTLVLDLAFDDPGAVTERRVDWLRALDGSGGAMIAAYTAGLAHHDATTGALEVPLEVALPGGQREAWTLRLARTDAFQVECTADTQCSTGEVCPSSVGVCVPASQWTPPPTTVGNQFEDPRSLAWWNAIDDLLGTGEAPATGAAWPAFATVGADLIETLMCTTDGTEAGAGRLGITQTRFDASSRSGDLACINGAGATTGVPGAVGLATHVDRKGTDASLTSSVLLSTCMQELARPVTGDFASNFSASVGDCVNLARFVPALRLLATGELGKKTRADADLRTRGLFTRLVQQWSQLHGFLASTGLSDREFDDAIAATPQEARSEMLGLLDTLDAGWAALLDKRIAPMFPAASDWAPSGPGDVDRDYRLLKRPVAYWPLNGAQNPTQDIIQNSTLGHPFQPCDLRPGGCGDFSSCNIRTNRNSFRQDWNCRGYATGLTTGASFTADRNLSVAFNVDPLESTEEEFPPYSGGTILAIGTLAVIQTWLPDGQMALLLVHPTQDGAPNGVEQVWFTGFGWLGNFQSVNANVGRGSSVAVVRDTVSKTYTLYLYTGNSASGQPRSFTQPYHHVVGGALTGMFSPQSVFLGIGPFVAPSHWWSAYNRSYPAFIDDVAIFNSALSLREFKRYAVARGYLEARRDVWPTNMSLGEFGTQEITTPVGAALLEAQAAHLEVVARLVEHMRYEAQIGCEADGAAAAAARADLNAIAARVGRTLRQSTVIEGFARSDDSEQADKARQLLRAKRSEIGRRLDTVTSCANPYGMGADEVPLYFPGMSQITDERAAFFAASDFLLGLAQDRATTAQNVLTQDFRTNWLRQRDSKIQQMQVDSNRDIRVGELTSKYGTSLLRLCGIADELPEDIVRHVKDGTFSVDTCFVKPTTSCLQTDAAGPIMDASPTCYRGVLGGALMDIRASYHAEQAAYQSWQAAIGNAEAAERLCVLKEMDAFGCQALDRHKLEGVTCPANHQGTIELIQAYNAELNAQEQSKAAFAAVMGAVSGIAKIAAATAVTGPGGAFLAAAQSAFGPLETEMANAGAQRARNHQLALQKIAINDAIRSCWNQAEQYERAIAAAEEGSRQATAKLQSATITFESAIGEAHQIALEAPVVIDREANRASIPITFHYWLHDDIQNYRFALESARRYAYMALRATEYDALDSFKVAQSNKPLRSAVLGAWRPTTLLQQIALLRDQTNSRTTRFGPPRLGHMTFDLGAKFFGLAEGADEFGARLAAHARPVYSTTGEYLGRGVRFSLVPQADAEPPTWRCAERIWRVNVGTGGYPPGTPDDKHIKLLKRTTFASRRCRGDGFQVATVRPSANLLVGAGDPATYETESGNSPADLPVVRLDTPGALENFRNSDTALDGSSTELFGQGLFGDYVLLFPSTTLAAGVVLEELYDFNVRFDFMSVDDTPPTRRAAGAARIELDPDPRSIVVE